MRFGILQTWEPSKLGNPPNLALKGFGSQGKIVPSETVAGRIKGSDLIRKPSPQTGTQKLPEDVLVCRFAMTSPEPVVKKIYKVQVSKCSTPTKESNNNQQKVIAKIMANFEHHSCKTYRVWK